MKRKKPPCLMPGRAEEEEAWGRAFQRPLTPEEQKFIDTSVAAALKPGKVEANLTAVQHRSPFMSAAKEKKGPSLSVKNVFTPEEIRQKQRENNLPAAERLVSHMMSQLIVNYRPDKPLVQKLTDSYGYHMDLVKELAQEAFATKGWNFNLDIPTLTVTITKSGEAEATEQVWHGVLRLSNSEEICGLMVVKADDEMDSGYDVLSHVNQGKPTDVHLLDMVKGWVWIGVIAEGGASVEEQAVEQLAAFMKGNKK